MFMSILAGLAISFVLIVVFLDGFIFLFGWLEKDSREEKAFQEILRACKETENKKELS